MKKNRLFAVLLIIALFASIMSVSAVADNENASYKEYFIFGDSVATGYGLKEGNDLLGYIRAPEGDNPDTRTLFEGCYAKLLADYTGAKTHMYGISGLRSVDQVYLLDKTYQPDRYAKRHISYLGNVPMNVFAQWQDKVETDLSMADLITVNIGSNDMLAYGLMRLVQVFDDAAERKMISDKTYGEVLKEAEKALNDLTGNQYESVVRNLLNVALYAGFLPEATANFFAGFMDGMIQFGDRWNTIISLIRDKNPDATIVAISLFNPMHDLTLTDHIKIPIGKLADANTVVCNKYMRDTCDLRSEYLYCDITDVETFGPKSLTDNNWSGNPLLGVHPNFTGHRQIAEKIEKLLEENPKGSPEPSVPDSASNSIDVTTVTEGGNATLSTNKAEQGETVTLQVQAQNNYDLGDIAAISGDGKEIELKKESNGYSFVMPDSPVSIAVSFVQRVFENVSCSFADVKTDSWYEKYIKEVYEKGWMAGMTDTLFKPDVPLDRGMVITMLYAIANKPDVTIKTPFLDVPENSYYAKAAAWGAQEGITIGRGNSLFAPKSKITREEFITMIHQFMEWMGIKTGSGSDLKNFKDYTSISQWAVDDMSWAIGNEILSGKPGKLLDPKGTTTRAEAAAILVATSSLIK